MKKVMKFEESKEGYMGEVRKKRKEENDVIILEYQK